MSNVKIFITPSSISIYDTNNNKLVVRKTIDGIYTESSTGNTRLNNSILKLQNSIKKFVTQKSKDNYKVRFAKLSTLLKEVGTHSFVSLANKLEAINTPTHQTVDND